MIDVLVLCYHAVSPTWDDALAVTPTAFEAQLTGLVSSGWRGASFTDAVLQPPFPRTLAITFDDGYLSVLEKAEPVLTRLGLPATVFVPTAFMTERQPLSWSGIDHWLETRFASELEGMCWADLESLTKLGWEIGSHTRTHAHLTQLDDPSAQAELEQSLRDCERHLGRPCTAVAYPYGDVDQRIADTAERAGYRAAACLSSRLSPAGALQFPRVGIYHNDRPWRFRMKANKTVRRIRATPGWPARR